MRCCAAWVLTEPTDFIAEVWIGGWDEWTM